MNRRQYFYIFSTLGLVGIYLVILAGSIVRTTGSGMGCPDWPKCFGQWIPPTHVTQLPENYEELFLSKRAQKLDKFASLLSSLGLEDTSNKMKNNPDLLQTEQFNPVTTWIEYINRLCGFLAGNLLLLAFACSFFLREKRKQFVVLSALAVLCTGFQGWFGSVVVTTNLTPWTITFHMLFALLILALLIHIQTLYSKPIAVRSTFFKPLIWITTAVTLIQIFLGTKVRQEIDFYFHAHIERSEWIELLSPVFEYHRSFAIVILVLNLILINMLRSAHYTRYAGIYATILILGIGSGIILSYMGVPKIAQPIHLITATLLFGFQYYLLNLPNEK